MAFKNERRQRFLAENHYQEFSGGLAETIKRREEGLTTEDSLIPKAISSFKWRIATSKLELLLLDYTAGISLFELRSQLPGVIQAFDSYIPYDNPRPGEAHTLEITQLEAYVYVFWLLALCKLLGHDALIPTVMKWIDANAEFNRGRDGLFESVVEKLTGSKVPVERVLLHPDAYRPLAKATVAEPEERPTLVKEFVENWYKNMKPCYWYGTHTDKEGSSYFGYWCFEAALVTYLWDIDDSSYRDHLVYPKDLVEWARLGKKMANADIANRCDAGQPCPQSGFWFTPAHTNSRRYFKQGEIMPSIGSDYGAIIWQWDADQTLPKL